MKSCQLQKAEREGGRQDGRWTLSSRISKGLRTLLSRSCVCLSTTKIFQRPFAGSTDRMVSR